MSRRGGPKIESCTVDPRRRTFPAHINLEVLCNNCHDCDDNQEARRRVVLSGPPTPVNELMSKLQIIEYKGLLLEVKIERYLGPHHDALCYSIIELAVDVTVDIEDIEWFVIRNNRRVQRILQIARDIPRSLPVHPNGRPCNNPLLCIELEDSY